MPTFVLNRNYRLRSLTGHTVHFIKGEKTFVPPALIKEVVALGAERTDEKQDAVVEDDEKVVLTLSPAERQEKLIEAIKVMMERNQRGDFTGNSLPNAKILASLAGLEELGNKERDAAWQAYLDAQNAE